MSVVNHSRPDSFDRGLDDWLDDCVDALLAKTAPLAPALRADVVGGLNLFEGERQPAATPPPSSLPVLDEFVADVASPHDLQQLFAALRWEPTMRSDDGGRDYGLAVLTDVLGLSTTQAGIMVVGDDRQYPIHQHAPAEVYLVLHGVGRWRSGGSEEYVGVEPGAIVVNKRRDVHSVIADQGPVAALYVLWP